MKSDQRRNRMLYLEWRNARECARNLRIDRHRAHRRTHGIQIAVCGIVRGCACPAGRRDRQCEEENKDAEPAMTFHDYRVCPGLLTRGQFVFKTSESGTRLEAASKFLTSRRDFATVVLKGAAKHLPRVAKS